MLNSRGLDLSPTDILKAEIVGGIPVGQRDAYTKKWEDIEEELGRDAFAELFSHIRMIYRRTKPKGTLIKEFKEHVTEINQPVHFINEVLVPMARAYGEIVSESYESISHAESINQHLKWLNRLEFTDWVPPALAFTTMNRQKPQAMSAFFGALEKLAYSLLIRKSGINERIERFSQLTSAVLRGTSLSTDVSPLNLTSFEQYEAYENLNGSFYENFSARARTTILLRLDTLLSGGGAHYDYRVITVEHVLPQTPSPESNWVEWFPRPENRQAWVHKLGNLALLTRKKNSAASNYDFERKKQSYFSINGISPFVLTTQVLGKDRWTPAIVEERQNELLNALSEHLGLNQKSGIATVEVGRVVQVTS